MSEQNDASQDRDLPASESKLNKAREQGQVARSRDLSSALGLGAGLAALIGLGGSLLESSRVLLGNALRIDARLLAETPGLADQRLFEWTVQLGSQALVAVMPILLICALGAIVGQLALGGTAWTTHPLMPDFNRLNPMQGLSRLLSKHHLMESLKLLLIVALLMLVAYGYVRSHVSELPGLNRLDTVAALSTSVDWLKGGALMLLGVLVLAALIDAPLQWKRHHDELKMTMQEAKQEAKEQEGDPHVRARIKGRQRELARSRMLAAVPQASVIVTNPTHFAVALRYDEGSMGAPKVVAKGVDLLAAKIREIATESGVPVLEAPPLARALYAHARLGMEVPPALYTAVAQVLAYIYQLRMHLQAAMPGRQVPELPTQLDVPQDLDPGVSAALDEIDQEASDDTPMTQESR